MNGINRECRMISGTTSTLTTGDGGVHWGKGARPLSTIVNVSTEGEGGGQT